MDKERESCCPDSEPRGMTRLTVPTSGLPVGIPSGMRSTGPSGETILVVGMPMPGPVAGPSMLSPRTTTGPWENVGDDDDGPEGV